MNSREAGFLLLSSHLADPHRRPLTMAQLRTLAVRAKALNGWDMSGELTEQALIAIGYEPAAAAHILELLSQDALLERYIARGAKCGCVPITRVSAAYPDALRKRLRLESPGCLWAKGDLSLLQKPCVALVGSRDLKPGNEAFAMEVGHQAAKQGYVLVSGNARGADRAAQNSCIYSGGKVISVVADSLEKIAPDPNVLYLCEEGYDLAFSSIRALSRNRVIHCLPRMTFVAQCQLGMGGTWSGTCKNLKSQWSPVFCMDDGSPSVETLRNLGAQCITGSSLTDFSELEQRT